MSTSTSTVATNAKVVFFAMTLKGLAAVTAFVDCYGPEAVEAVIGTSDAATLDDGYLAIQTFCEQRGIAFWNRKNHPPFTARFAFAIGWRWLIEEVGFTLVVFHDSLLPRYRGFSPLVNMLINGEREIGVTALRAAAEYDRGPILAQAKIPVTYPLKISAAIAQLGVLYGELAIKVFALIRQGDPLQGRDQDESQATYSLWRDADDYFIDWQQEASRIQRFIDAVGHPFLGAATQVAGKLIRIHEVEVLPDVTLEIRQVGKVLQLDEQGRPVIVCGSGLVKIITAVDDATGSSILPLKQFRLRFH